MKLLNNIARFEEHAAKATELKSKDVKDYFIYTALSMECFQAVNALIEIGEYIIASKKLGFPSTYREVFEILFRNNLIDERELEIAKRLVFLRNLIAHEYYRISEKELLEMAEKIGIISRFVDRLKNMK